MVYFSWYCHGCRPCHSSLLDADDEKQKQTGVKLGAIQTETKINQAETEINQAEAKINQAETETNQT